MPNAHIIAVATQENGPYVGLSTRHKEWEKLLEEVCLERRYTKIAAISLWAVHLIVFARTRDVAKYVRHAHVGSVKTGVMGIMGDKGGVAVGFSVSMRRSTALTVARRIGEKADEEKPAVVPVEPPHLQPITPSAADKLVGLTASFLDEAGSRRAPDGKEPPELSFLFIGAHLTAHQHNVTSRNQDYQSIVQRLPLGTKGPYAGSFDSVRCPRTQAPSNADPDAPSNCRDVTTEFDVCFFGGDLNYRINGTKSAIEYIVERKRDLRSVLSDNDQLIKEMRKGAVFHDFQEGPLRFRPTYKFHVVNGLAMDRYDLSTKNPRLPAYCDRILWKTPRHDSKVSAVVSENLYTDVTGVHSSDHRPVVAMFTVETYIHSDGNADDYDVDREIDVKSVFQCC
jgi:hypothetical protein